MRLPYPGLRPFLREASDLFFGREDCVDDMVDRLAATRFLAVLGTSGSGKSSLVVTGLLDALEIGPPCTQPLHPPAAGLGSSPIRRSVSGSPAPHRPPAGRARPAPLTAARFAHSRVRFVAERPCMHV
jgi:hypothetical protein